MLFPENVPFHRREATQCKCNLSGLQNTQVLVHMSVHFNEAPTYLTEHCHPEEKTGCDASPPSSAVCWGELGFCGALLQTDLASLILCG